MARQTDELKTGDLVKIELAEEMVKFAEERGLKTTHNKLGIVIDEPACPRKILLQDSYRIYFFEEQEFRYIYQKNVRLISKS